MITAPGRCSLSISRLGKEKSFVPRLSTCFPGLDLSMPNQLGSMKSPQERTRPYFITSWSEKLPRDPGLTIPLPETTSWNQGRWPQCKGDLLHECKNHRSVLSLQRRCVTNPVSESSPQWERILNAILNFCWSTFLRSIQEKLSSYSLRSMQVQKRGG